LRRIVMITGDNVFTACHVSKLVGIATKDVAILSSCEGRLMWLTMDDEPICALQAKR
jgi:magnesium-transporting ATPase (P-type)